jgi:arsenate reductase
MRGSGGSQALDSRALRELLQLNPPATMRNVLFLCTANSARSILAEALLNARGAGRFRGFSAGSNPGGRVNPAAIATLEAMGIATAALRSKSWEEFAQPGAPTMDLVITVCDNAAKEACPIWPGHPMTAHWGVSDPAAIRGTPDEVRAAFAEAASLLGHRIDRLLAVPLDALDPAQALREVRRIGQS